jgi:hypothetical protein
VSYFFTVRVAWSATNKSRTKYKGELKQMEASMTVQEAAKLMGKSQDFIRIGLQRNILPFGYAVKIGKERYSYFIGREKFTEATGIKSEGQNQND